MLQHSEVGKKDLAKEMEKEDLSVRSKEYQKEILDNKFLGRRSCQMLLNT